MSTFRELLEGKMIERCHHFDEKELRHFMAGARAALELAAEECDASAAWARSEIPKARAARDLTTENMRHMEDHINTHLAQKLRTLAADLGGS